MEKKKTNKKVKFSRFLVLILILSVLSSVFVISSLAAEVPTDLTDYKVTVPAGWTSNQNVGRFSLDGYIVIDGNNLSLRGEPGYGSFGIGLTKVSGGCTAATNSVYVLYYDQSNKSTYSNFNSDTPFTLIFAGGTDVTNSTLIQWFASNNATFENLNVPPPSQQISSVWTQIMSWIVSALSSVQAVFFSDGGLTFLGSLAIISVAIGLAFLLIAVISRFLSLRS